MPNRFHKVTTVQELMYQVVGAGSVCWENPGGAGIFDTDEARAVATEGLQRLFQLLNHTPEADTEVNLNAQFRSFIRKPFRVSAVEITRENIREVADMIGEFREDDSGPYIEADPEKVPTVNRVIPGYWVTQMGKNIRCYSPKAFHEQFAEMTPSLDRLMRKVDETTKEPISA